MMEGATFAFTSILQGTLSYCTGKALENSHQPSSPQLTEEKNLEGITVVFLLAALRWLPIGTKIHWEEHHISYHIPEEHYLLGVTRRLKGDGRATLSQIKNIIKKALDLFPPDSIHYQDEIGIVEKIDDEQEFKKIETIDYSKLSPITHIWYSCIDGLIAQQETYKLQNLDENLSLEEKPSCTIFKFDETLNWKERNQQEKFSRQKVAEDLHDAIMLIKQALVEGHQEAKNLTSLGKRVKENYTPDDFCEINRKLLRLREKHGNKSPIKFEDKETFEAIQAFCAAKVKEYISFWKLETQLISN